MISLGKLRKRVAAEFKKCIELFTSILFNYRPSIFEFDKITIQECENSAIWNKEKILLFNFL